MPEVLNSTGPAGVSERYEEYTKQDVAVNDVAVEQNQENDGDLHLKRNQKFALVFICVLTLGVVSLGILQAKNVLNIPAAKMGNGSTQQVASTAMAEAQKESPEELKKKDTDGDKVNDFEEIKIYDTSPYLSDSDSDGVSDFDEIKAGEDPTCPKGQECFRNANSANVANANDVNNLDTNGANDAGANLANTADSANITPAQLRQVLVKSGQLTQEQVEQIDDETLLSVYKEALDKNPDLVETQTTQTGADPASLTSAQIKQLLIEQGVDAATLSQVDDETLRNLYLNALKQAQERSGD